jgi:vitamin B12 transporter
MMSSTKQLVLISLLGFLSTISYGDETEDLDSIVVTATRSNMAIEDATLPVTIIGRDQIEQSLARDISQLLRFEAGLDIGRNGGPGQTTSLFLRGTESNHTLVLVDGVRINPGTIGGAALQNINPDIIERIEIVKGSRSALYGTDAIGGVINIITRKAKSSYIESGYGYGMYDTKKRSIDLGFNSGSTELGLSVNSNKTDGYKIRTDSDIKRGYENLTTNFHIGQIFQNSDITLRHWRTSGKVEYLDFFLTAIDQDFINDSSAIEINNNFKNNIQSRVIISRVQDDITQNQSTSYVYSKRNILDGQISMLTGSHNITGGLYLSDEEASSFAFGSGFNKDTQSNAIFIQDHISEGNHRVFIAARLSDHETFGKETTWNAEYGMSISDQWSINASAGHAFRAPDATDRYGYGGNINLKPEVSDDIQLNVAFRPDDNTTYRLELFDTKIENLIEYDFAKDQMLNIGQASMRGLQMSYHLINENYSIRADYINQKAENDINKTLLLRRPKQSFTLNISKKLKNFDFGLSLLASGERKDFGVTLPGYAIVNLTGQFKLNDTWTINTQIENILDKHYETAAKYRMQGRSVFFDLTRRW